MAQNDGLTESTQLGLHFRIIFDVMWPFAYLIRAEIEWRQAERTSLCLFAVA
jgi:hypothetical protein